MLQSLLSGPHFDLIRKFVKTRDWSAVRNAVQNLLQSEFSGLPSSHSVFSVYQTIAFLAEALEAPDNDVDTYKNIAARYRLSNELSLITDAILFSLEKKSPNGLLFASDRISQTWPDYERSQLPQLFLALSEKNSIAASLVDFTDTSYSTWYRALRMLSEMKLDGADALLTRSAELYRIYEYYGDAAWLFTDLVVCSLLENNQTRALEYLSRQTDYLSTLNSSGQNLSELWNDRFYKYVISSQHFIEFYHSKNPAEFKAAIDCFSYDWSTYGETYYIAIFNNLRRMVTNSTSTNFYMDAHETLYSVWTNATKLFFINASLERLHVSLSEVRARLRYLNATPQWSVCLLDEIVLRFSVEGDMNKSWHSEKDMEICAHVCRDLTDEIVKLRLSRNLENRLEAVRAYISRRDRYDAPEIISLYAGIEEHLTARVNATSNIMRPQRMKSRLDVTLMDRDLYINGILIWHECPEGIVDILVVLGESFLRARGRGISVPTMSSDEVANKVGKSSGAVAQLVRRLRRRIETVLVKHWGESGTEYGQMIEGRKGYRLSDELVFGWRIIKSDVQLLSNDSDDTSNQNTGSNKARTKLRIISSK